MLLEKIILRPLRDLVLGPSLIKNSVDVDDADEEIKIIIKGVLRITFAASAVFFVIKTHSSVPIAAAVGACLSVPCTLIAGGGYLLYHGATVAAAALASGCFKSAAIAIASFVAGYCALEWHDNWIQNDEMQKKICQFGALEWILISPAAESWETVSSWFK